MYPKIQHKEIEKKLKTKRNERGKMNKKKKIKKDLLGRQEKKETKNEISSNILCMLTGVLYLQVCNSNMNLFDSQGR